MNSAEKYTFRRDLTNHNVPSPPVAGSTLEEILAAARSQPESAAVAAEGVVDSEDDSDSSSSEDKAARPPSVGEQPGEAAVRSLSPVPSPRPADVGDDSSSSSSDAEEGDSQDSADGFTFVKEVRIALIMVYMGQAIKDGLWAFMGHRVPCLYVSICVF